MRRLQLTMLGLSAGVIAAGCAVSHKAIAPTNMQATIPPSIQQIGYGLDARFTWCSGSRCPTRTVKTLAYVERAPAAAVFARPPVPFEGTEIHKLITVPFDTGSARLSDQQAQVIDAAFTEAMHVRRIVIRGRTDSNGSPRRNDLLAGRRAEVVRDYLTKARLNDSVEITLESKGSCCYAADNHSASGRAANRRVEVEVLIVSP